jgi:hypothetical protein
MLGQIWLNLLVDDCQFGYITKLKKKHILLVTMGLEKFKALA